MLVETRSGPIEGFTKNGLRHYLGVPFAKPPVGALRFRAPQRVEPWDEPRLAMEYGCAPPQHVFPKIEGMSFAAPDLGAETSEDCLYLNVWTAVTAGERRPVMVWIPGGGFVLGSGSLAGQVPADLAVSGEVVVVSFNYRLGALGFLRLSDIVTEEQPVDDNVGLLDQIAALEWVRDNIAAFGGDPDNVTIFGISAGAMSVGTLLGTPRARGLFHRAIAQSGAAHNVSDAATATRVAQGVLKELGLGPSDVHKLWELPFERIVEAQERYYSLIASVTWPGPFVDPERRSAAVEFAYQPHVDGSLLARQPLDTIALGEGSAVPVLAGTTKDDQRGSEYADGRCPQDADGLLAALVERIPGASDDASRASQVLAAYPFPTPGRDNAARAFSQIETHRLFRIPAIRLLDAMGQLGVPTFMYLFTWESPFPIVGAGHGLDAPFLLGNLHEPGMDLYAGTGSDAEHLSKVMQRSWIAFATTGDPANEMIGVWPEYRPDQRSVLALGADIKVFDEPVSGALAVWKDLL